MASSNSAPSAAEQKIINEFREKRAKIDSTRSKIYELYQESYEHNLVIQALEKVDTARKCFRLVGEVLVERTVGEILPAVRRNMENIDSVVRTLYEQLAKQEEEVKAFQEKHGLRIRSGDEPKEEPKQEAAKKPASQGVLV
uniref:Prefoldin subunit 2 n=1 Tax=Polytomella parva TaxID=51329 RepID=A0A7S0VD46_9CHLO|mmetsp:Transcript_33319/g.60217  ORF Transcript_33319/g.60217 Transcript_33319/m.60217 type:complete len:141 (+) Transcript_33319:135-557(+)|eukprot:CAMPEP_0175063054 /NCGR_PEP_ID=MMETSP0052_2-20121109/14525_1 /TAXON_ID=51329 ORGANISM="Polytomella parva, Strain SAG 63-3" /NCGR_SAMPLE_ID=MMETSP0052_2 /ASSEMBLY_ACC=CAM_ASM_000194 /LENGTH=140 /DNA_ID=CAMNT_0016329173 /DNA_START=49 /DNA_END=471 /DNA_ORIENTATION=-